MHKVWLKLKTRWAVLCHDLLSVPVAWLGAYWLRFNLDEIPPEYLKIALHHLPFIVVIQAACFYLFGLYRGVWRFASLPDLLRIIKSVALGSLLISLLVFLTSRSEFVPRSSVLIYSLLLSSILGGSRFVYRCFKDRLHFKESNQKRVLIIGAGSAGESLARDLLRNQKELLPVAFIDDSEQKHARELHGIPIVGGTDQIDVFVKTLQVELIFIALPSANHSQMRKINELCQATRLPVRTLPGTNDLISGRVTVASLRDVSIEDLLGRDPVELDWQGMKDSIQGKTVFVSGGAGSIGSELCRQLLRLAPRNLVVLDNSEYHLFKLQQALQKVQSSVNLHFILIDIGDETGLNDVFARFSPNIVFHAAAYKHVPLLQSQLRAAVKNNVWGTYCFAKAAVEFKVEKFVQVSTDKVVSPTNIMGGTKRLAELVCQYFHSQNKTQFFTVRFGNVLGSRGSVLETFKKQLETGEALTITDPDVSRYFMTISEATQLILQAQAFGKGGELFVLDMGEPVKIQYMAEQLVHLSGKKLGKDIQIAYIGLRPGEKLYEELFFDHEDLVKTPHNKIRIAKHSRIDCPLFYQQLQELFTACTDNNELKMQAIMVEWVPKLKEIFKLLQASSITHRHQPQTFTEFNH